MDEILISSNWDCLLSIIRTVTSIIHVTKSYWESITCIVLLFIVYTVTITIHCYWYCSPCIRILLTVILHRYSHRIVLVIEIIYILTVLNNNIYNLHQDWKKLLEEKASIFWVDLGYRLSNRLTVPLQGSGGWLKSLLFHSVTVSIVPQWYCKYYYCYWLPGGRVGFSAGIWAVVPVCTGPT